MVFLKCGDYSKTFGLSILKNIENINRNVKKHTCSVCNKPKNVDQFNWRHKNQKIKWGYCRACQKKYKDQHYQDNKKFYQDKQRKRRKEKSIWWQEFKKTLKCERCLENHPACLQFHHKNPKKKEKELSLVCRSWSIERLMKEVKKCKVLCANCHFKLHYGER